MAEKLGLRTVGFAGIQIAAWAQREGDGNLFSSRAVWGENPVVTESSLGIIREGGIPLSSSVDEAVGEAIREAEKMIRLGKSESP